MLKNSKESFYKSECKVEEILLDGDNPQHRGIMNNFTNYLLGNEELTSNLNEEEFKEQFRKIHSMFLENKQFVNDIYTDIHKNIENINQEVREKTYKYLYCQK